MSKVNIFVQCRLNSSRFPNKIFSKINGKTIIEILLTRLLRCKLINEIVILAPLKDKKKLNSKNIKIPNIKFFYGNELNVFDRYLKASRIYKSEYIVRITSDCPLIDPEMVDKMTKIIKKKDYDYFSNINPPTFPDGFDIEIFKSNLLNVQLKLGLNHLDKEHVTYNIKKLNFISKGNFCTLEDKSHYRITVDYKDDLNILKKISSKKDLNLIDTHEVLKILRNEKLTKRIRNVKLSMNQTKNMWYKANKYIPNGNSLLSKNPRIYEEDNWPSHYESAYGIQIKDLDGKKYLDFSNMGVGTNILGYNNKKVNKFVISKINNSNMSSLNCPEEVLLAEKLVQIHPWSQKALFARTGAEANSIAVRLARAYTKKNIVLICGYHGWNDWYLSANYSNKKNLNNHLFKNLKIDGVDKSLKNSCKPFEFNDLAKFKKIFKKYSKNIACVIMEVKRDLEPDKKFLKYIRTTCTKNNAVLIFDECTSGFRENFGGIHLKYKINPDLAMFGKALGNGFAINAVLGKSNIMDRKFNTFISSTFWTERAGPSAGLKTLQEMNHLKSWDIICKNGKYLRKEIKSIVRNNKDVFLNKEGLIPNLQLRFSNSLIKKIYINFMLSKGILASERIYLSIAHDKKNIKKFLFNFKLFINYLKNNCFISN